MKDNSYDFCDNINCSLIETDTTGDALYLLLLTLKNSISWYICAVFWDFIEIKLINYLLNFFFYILMNHACQQNTGIVILKKNCSAFKNRGSSGRLPGFSKFRCFMAFSQDEYT